MKLAGNGRQTRHSRKQEAKCLIEELRSGLKAAPSRVREGRYYKLPNRAGVIGSAMMLMCRINPM